MKKLFAVCLLAGLVTLAGCSSSQTASAQYIGMEAARSAALKDAGVTEGEFTGVTLEEKDGTVYYEVEFTAGGAKYEYAVDALTGTIIEGKWKENDDGQGESEASSTTQESAASSQQESSSSQAQSSQAQASQSQEELTQDRAVEIAVEDAGVTDYTLLKAQRDYDDGRLVYEVEFYSADGKEYDYEIDAATGEVLSKDYDAEGTLPQGDGTTSITEEEAKALVLKQVPGATEQDILEFATDYDDGRLEYEGKLFYNATVYEFTVDGYSGTIREWEAEKAAR